MIAGAVVAGWGLVGGIHEQCCVGRRAGRGAGWLHRTRVAWGIGRRATQPAIPALDTVESLLSFANTTVEYGGRAGELEELKGFLAVESPFSWWLWAGPAGIGKSRLAVDVKLRLTGVPHHAGQRFGWAVPGTAQAAGRRGISCRLPRS